MTAQYPVPNRSLSLSSSMTMWSIAMFLGAVVMGGCVFAVTQAAQQHEAAIESMNRDIVSERQSIRVLEAEWAYLTRPQRLEELMAMKQNDATMPPSPAPIATMLPEDNAAVPPAEDVAMAAPVEEAKTEPAAGAAMVATPEKVAPPKKVAEVGAKPKAEAPKVKTASVSKPKASVKSTKTVDVWPIEKKRAQQYARATPVYQSTPVSTRYGRQIARPILE